MQKGVCESKRNKERAKYDIMVTLREKMAKNVAESLGKENDKLRASGEPVPVHHPQDGLVTVTTGINPSLSNFGESKLPSSISATFSLFLNIIMENLSY